MLDADSEDLKNLSPSDIQVKRFKHQSVAQDGKLLFPYADGSLKLFDLPNPLRGEMPARRTPEQDEKEQEGQHFSKKKNGDYFWTMSGDIKYRHHEAHRATLCVPDETTVPIPLNTRRCREANENKNRQRLRAHAERLLESRVRSLALKGTHWNNTVPNLEGQPRRVQFARHLGSSRLKILGIFCWLG